MVPSRHRSPSLLPSRVPDCLEHESLLYGAVLGASSAPRLLPLVMGVPRRTLGAARDPWLVSSQLPTRPSDRRVRRGRATPSQSLIVGSGSATTLNKLLTTAVCLPVPICDIGQPKRGTLCGETQ